jgi:hypothetical protein
MSVVLDLVMIISWFFMVKNSDVDFEYLADHQQNQSIP